MEQTLSRIFIFIFFLACIYYAKTLNDKKRKLEALRDVRNKDGNDTILGYKVAFNERREKIQANKHMSAEQIKEALSKIDEIENSYKNKD